MSSERPSLWDHLYSFIHFSAESSEVHQLSTLLPGLDTASPYLGAHSREKTTEVVFKSDRECYGLLLVPTPHSYFEALISRVMALVIRFRWGRELGLLKMELLSL